MVNKPLIRPAISWGGSFGGGGVNRIPMIIDPREVILKNVGKHL